MEGLELPLLCVRVRTVYIYIKLKVIIIIIIVFTTTTTYKIIIIEYGLMYRSGYRYYRYILGMNSLALDRVNPTVFDINYENLFSEEAIREVTFI